MKYFIIFSAIFYIGYGATLPPQNVLNQAISHDLDTWTSVRNVKKADPNDMSVLPVIKAELRLPSVTAYFQVTNQQMFDKFVPTTNGSWQILKDNDSELDVKVSGQFKNELMINLWGAYSITGIRRETIYRFIQTIGSTNYEILFNYNRSSNQTVRRLIQNRFKLIELFFRKFSMQKFREQTVLVRFSSPIFMIIVSIDC